MPCTALTLLNLLSGSLGSIPGGSPCLPWIFSRCSCVAAGPVMLDFSAAGTSPATWSKTQERPFLSPSIVTTKSNRDKVFTWPLALIRISLCWNNLYKIRKQQQDQQTLPCLGICVWQKLHPNSLHEDCCGVQLNMNWAIPTVTKKIIPRIRQLQSVMTTNKTRVIWKDSQ